MATVFLHAGTMKSGTTYLQDACEKNQDLLAEAGIAWHGRALNFQAIQDLRGSERLHPGNEGSWRVLARKIRRTEHDSLVSMELLCTVGPKQIQTIARRLAPHDLHLILTVRDVSKVVPSHWQETTQNRGTIRWQDYCAEICETDNTLGQPRTAFWRHHDISWQIARWSSVVPTERITVVTVPPSGSPAELLWERFLSAMDRAPMSDFAPPRRTNPALGVVSAEVMRRVNSQVQDIEWPVYQLGFKAIMAKTVLAGRAADEPRFQLSPQHHAVIRERSLAMVEAVKGTGVRVVGDLADIVPPETAATGGIAEAEVSDGLLLEAAIDGLAGVGKALGRSRTTVQRLSTQVSELERQVERLRGRLEAQDRTSAQPEGRTAGGGLTATVRDAARRIPPLRWAVRKARALRA